MEKPANLLKTYLLQKPYNGVCGDWVIQQAEDLKLVKVKVKFISKRTGRVIPGIPPLWNVEVTVKAPGVDLAFEQMCYRNKRSQSETTRWAVYRKLWELFELP